MILSGKSLYAAISAAVLLGALAALVPTVLRYQQELEATRAQRDEQVNKVATVEHDQTLVKEGAAKATRDKDATIDRLRSDLDASRSREKALETQLKDAQASRQTLAAEDEDARRHVEKQAQTLADKVGQLQAELTRTTQENAALRQQLETLQPKH